MTKEEFKKVMQVYEKDNKVFECRILKADEKNIFKGRVGTISGYFDDIDIAYDKLEKYFDRISVYFTLQNIDSSLLARNCNKLKKFADNLTSDNNVLNYRWLHIDVDPKRAAGIQATEQERLYGEERINEIVQFLNSELGYPKPIICFSGNGHTADYRLDNIISNKKNQDIIKASIAAISTLFTDDKVDIDKSVYNPARIIKIPGCLSCKGCNTEDRPYRNSKIISLPDEGTVSLEMLKKLARMEKELHG